MKSLKKYVLVIISIVLILSSYNGFSQIPTDGLVGYYMLDGNTTDSGPLGNDGVIQGTGSVVPTTNRFGEADKAMLFTEGSISLGNSPELNFTDSISVAAWVNTTLMDGWSGLITKWDNSLNSGFFLGINPDRNVVRLNLSNMPAPIDGDPTVLGEWMHVAATFDGDTAKLYYNGELADMVAHNISIPQNGNDFRLGSQTDGTGTHWGAMDDVQIYNRGLSEDEVKMIFESGGGIRTTQTLTICDGESIVVGTNTYDTAGTYTDILTAANGSDSTVTTELIVNTVDAGVTLSGMDLTANASNASYQWVDCNDNNTPIAGETNATFTATVSGSYAVMVTENGCTEMSICTDVSVSGVSENLLKSICVYPNPTEGEFIISNDLNLRMSVKLIDMVGTVVYSEIINESSHVLNISSLTSGVYILQMRMGEMHNTVKLIKQ